MVTIKLSDEQAALLDMLIDRTPDSEMMTQFGWTTAQVKLVNEIMDLLPERPDDWPKNLSRRDSAE